MTSSANAPAPPAAALPTTDRRAFLATLAAAGVMTGATAALAAAEGDHLDAELLELVALLTAADARRSDLGFQSDAAYAERYREPPFSEAVLWRRSDWTSVWMEKDRLDSTFIEGVERFLYVTDGALTDLYGKLAQWKAVAPLDRNCGPGDMARVEEIIAAVEVWKAEEKQAWDAAGMSELDAAYGREASAVAALLQRIAAIPARTSRGMCAKAAAAAIAAGRRIEGHEQELSMLLARADRDHDETEHMLAVSLIVDAMKLGTAAPASSVERSAA